MKRLYLISYLSSENGKRAMDLSTGSYMISRYSANEGPVRIQYKCLVPIYVFPEIKPRRTLFFPKQNYVSTTVSSYSTKLSSPIQNYKIVLKTILCMALSCIACSALQCITIKVTLGAISRRSKHMPSSIFGDFSIKMALQRNQRAVMNYVD